MNKFNGTKAEYQSIADKPGQEILDMIKRKELSPPTKGDEKERFIKFVQADVGSPDRTALLSEPGAPAASPSTEEGTPPVTPDPVKKPVEGSPGAAPEAASAKTINDLIAEIGYNDPKEFVSSFTELRETAAKLQNALNKANASAGRLGREKGNLETQLKTINDKLKEVEEKAKPKEMDPPVMPEMPDPKKFSEGALDDGYVDAVSKWRNDMVTYQAKMVEFSNAVKPAWAKKLEQDLSVVSDQMGDVKKKTDNISQDTATHTFEKAWGEFWDNEVVGLQNQFGLQTTVPYKAINENKLIIENADTKDADGKPIYLPEQVETAKKWFASLPDKDRKAFSKVAKLLRVTHDFSGETPARKYQRDPRAAIIEAGLETEYPLMRQSSSGGGAPSESADSVKPMSGGGIGANDPSLSAPQGKAEMQKRLGDIMAMARKNTAAFKQNTELVKEYNELIVKLGYKKPR